MTPSRDLAILEAGSTWNGIKATKTMVESQTILPLSLRDVLWSTICELKPTRAEIAQLCIPGIALYGKR